MNDRQTAPRAQTMQLSDILYVLFRHKWKITIISVVAMIAAGSSAPKTESVAKLYIK
jgi:LPS O-antigen subunit length determinant protein (WzzB/FepE family)